MDDVTTFDDNVRCFGRPAPSGAPGRKKLSHCYCSSHATCFGGRISYRNLSNLLDEVVDPDLLLRRHEEEGFGAVEPNALHLSLAGKT